MLNISSGEIILIIIISLVLLKPSDIKKTISYISDIVIKINEYIYAIKKNINNIINTTEKNNKK